MPSTLRRAVLALALPFALVACSSEAPQPVAPLAEAPAVCCPAAPDDWPQYRGLDRQGAVEMSISPWTDAGLVELWRRPIGAGFASLAIGGDRLFTSAEDGGDEVLLALDPDTGDELWRQVLGPEFDEEFGDGPRSTPTVDDRGMVYALSSRAGLVAADGRDGTLIWTRDLHPDFGGDDYDRGYSSSPLIDGERLILNVGPADDGAVVALERTTGSILWSSQDGVAAYSSPIAAEVDGQLHIVTPIGRGLVGLDPNDGTLLWEHEWPTRWGLNIAMPVAVPGGRFLISSAYDQGAAMVEVRRDGDGWSADAAWTERLFRNHFATSVYLDGLLYGFDDDKLACLDAATGAKRWATRDYGKGTLVRVGQTLVVVSDSGDVALVEATGEAFRELA
ncbi:MAG: PQQ-binding-like beta-propeller repeat protein, partial [Acidobacteriota bacterium]